MTPFVVERPSMVARLVARLAGHGADPWQVLAEELSQAVDGPCVVVVRDGDGDGRPVGAAVPDRTDLPLLQVVLRSSVVPADEMAILATTGPGFVPGNAPGLLRRWVGETTSLTSHVLPIVVGLDVVGVVWLGTDQDRDQVLDVRPLQDLVAVAVLGMQRADSVRAGDTHALLSSAIMSSRADEVEAAHQTIDRIGSFVGHEIRDALRGVLGWSRLAAAPGLSDDIRREMVRKIVRTVEHAGAVVGDVLEEVDEAQAGRVEQVAVDLNGVGGWVREVLADRLHQQHATLRLDPLPTVMGGPTTLRRCLLELVRNALDHGGQYVEIHVSSRFVRPDVEIRVRDNGPGLGPHTRAHAFEAGFGTGTGTGYGLTQVRQALEAIGASVWLEDGTDGGLTSVILLPGQALPVPSSPGA